jgi:hypothetical protein
VAVRLVLSQKTGVRFSYAVLASGSSSAAMTLHPRVRLAARLVRDEEALSSNLRWVTLHMGDFTEVDRMDEDTVSKTAAAKPRCRFDSCGLRFKRV